MRLILKIVNLSRQLTSIPGRSATGISCYQLSDYFSEEIGGRGNVRTYYLEEGLTILTMNAFFYQDVAIDLRKITMDSGFLFYLDISKVASTICLDECQELLIVDCRILEEASQKDIGYTFLTNVPTSVKIHVAGGTNYTGLYLSVSRNRLLRFIEMADVIPSNNIIQTMFNESRGIFLSNTREQTFIGSTIANSIGADAMKLSNVHTYTLKLLIQYVFNIMER